MPYLQPFSYVVVFCVSFLSMYGVTLHVCLCCEQGAVWPPWPDAGAPKAAPPRYPWGRSGGRPCSVATGTAPQRPVLAARTVCTGPVRLVCVAVWRGSSRG